MGSNWKPATLGELLDSGKAFLQTGPFGTALKANEYTVTGVPLISVREIREGYFQIEEATPRVDQSVLSRLPKFVLKTGDIVFARKGGIERNALITKTENGWFLGSDGIFLRFTDDNDSRFFSYVMRSPSVKEWLIKNCEGTTMPSLNQKILSRLPVYVPLLEEQMKVADWLEALDNKITLNRQMNQTLERMAQALFKSWFVDFDPVVDNALDTGFFEQDLAFPDELLRRAEARRAVREHADFKPLPDATRQLFPAAFEECAEPSLGLGGWVPQGWKHGCVADVARYSTKRIDTEELTLENYISTENMLADRKGIQPAATLPTVNSVPAYTTGCILISNIRPYFKKIWLANGNGGHSNDVLGFEAKDSDTECYVFNLMYQDSFFDFMMATSKGSKMPRGDKKAILEWVLIVPPLNLRRFFSERVRNFYTASYGRHHENITLAQLRDTLLPKLISGELRLDNFEADFAKEGVA